MSDHHINIPYQWKILYYVNGSCPIKQLTNIELNDDLGINARECAHRIKIGKDNVYTYYRLFK